MAKTVTVNTILYLFPILFVIISNNIKKCSKNIENGNKRINVRHERYTVLSSLPFFPSKSSNPYYIGFNSL